MTPEPIVGADLFRAVMAAAGGQCQCTGQCGQSHTKTGGRCLRQHGGRVRLVAAPADPATPDRQAVILPAGRLRAWCPACLTGAQRTAQRTAAAVPSTDQRSLFDL